MYRVYRCFDLEMMPGWKVNDQATTSVASLRPALMLDRNVLIQKLYGSSKIANRFILPQTENSFGVPLLLDDLRGKVGFTELAP